MASAPEIERTYGSLGCSPEETWRVSVLVAELKALIRTEIPDPSAFGKALGDIRTQLNRSGEGGAGPSLLRAWFESPAAALLRDILDSSDNPGRLAEHLNLDPVGQPLPFIEQLPFFRDGELIWRAPVAVTLIRKRPADPDRFCVLLEDLEGTVRRTRLARSPAAADQVLAEVRRLRGDAHLAEAYFPPGVKRLERAVADWLDSSLSPASGEKKGRLDATLLRLAGLLSREGPVVTEAEAARFCEEAEGAARDYLDAPWMHTSWLTTRFLVVLLDAELTRLSRSRRRSRRPPAETLRRVRDEVVTGRYDGGESVRRLQEQEARGLYVHSLIPALLRLPIPANGGVEEG